MMICHGGEAVRRGSETERQGGEVGGEGAVNSQAVSAAWNVIPRP